MSKPENNIFQLLLLDLILRDDSGIGNNLKVRVRGLTVPNNLGDIVGDYNAAPKPHHPNEFLPSDIVVVEYDNQVYIYAGLDKAAATTPSDFILLSGASTLNFTHQQSANAVHIVYSGGQSYEIKLADNTYAGAISSENYRKLVADWVTFGPTSSPGNVGRWVGDWYLGSTGVLHTWNGTAWLPIAGGGGGLANIIKGAIDHTAPTSTNPTTFTLPHTFGATPVLVAMYDENKELIYPDSVLYGVNTVTVTFLTPVNHDYEYVLGAPSTNAGGGSAFGKIYEAAPGETLIVVNNQNPNTGYISLDKPALNAHLATAGAVSAILNALDLVGLTVSSTNVPGKVLRLTATGGSTVAVVNGLGTDTTVATSQKLVTDELAKKIDKTSISTAANSLGTDPTKVISENVGHDIKRAAFGAATINSNGIALTLLSVAYDNIVSALIGVTTALQNSVFSNNTKASAGVQLDTATNALNLGGYIGPDPLKHPNNTTSDPAYPVQAQAVTEVEAGERGYRYFDGTAFRSLIKFVANIIGLTGHKVQIGDDNAQVVLEHKFTASGALVAPLKLQHVGVPLAQVGGTATTGRIPTIVNNSGDTYCLDLTNTKYFTSWDAIGHDNNTPLNVATKVRHTYTNVIGTQVEINNEERAASVLNTGGGLPNITTRGLITRNSLGTVIMHAQFIYNSSVNIPSNGLLGVLPLRYRPKQELVVLTQVLPVGSLYSVALLLRILPTGEIRTAHSYNTQGITTHTIYVQDTYETALKTVI
jgi:hypothetical protein